MLVTSPNLNDNITTTCSLNQRTKYGAPVTPVVTPTAVSRGHDTHSPTLNTRIHGRSTDRSIDRSSSISYYLLITACEEGGVAMSEGELEEVARQKNA
jgi:hypothetical protein